MQWGELLKRDATVYLLKCQSKRLPPILQKRTYATRGRLPPSEVDSTSTFCLLGAGSVTHGDVTSLNGVGFEVYSAVKKVDYDKAE